MNFFKSRRNLLGTASFSEFTNCCWLPDIGLKLIRSDISPKKINARSDFFHDSIQISQEIEVFHRKEQLCVRDEYTVLYCAVLRGDRGSFLSV